MARLPVGKRIKSVVMPDTLTDIVSTENQSLVVDSFVFDEDVTLVGAELALEALAIDAHYNADGMMNFVAYLTPQSNPNLVGRIMRVAIQMGWTAGIVVGGGNLREIDHLFYPTGFGVDYDKGEAINTYLTAQWIGAGGNLGVYIGATLYYVER